MGRSRGGLKSKIHAVVDSNGLPLRLAFSPGEAHDVRLAGNLLSRLKSGPMLLADRGYDADWISELFGGKRRWQELKTGPRNPACACSTPYINWSACLRASVARSAATRIELSKRYSRDFVVILNLSAPARGTATGNRDLELPGAASSLPCRLLAGPREVRCAFTHFDQAEFGQLGQVVLPDQPSPLGSDVLQRPSQINGVKPEPGEGIFLLTAHLLSSPSFSAEPANLTAIAKASS